MTEEKKKPGIIKRIFRWIGLGLLVALILGAIIYDAPWKVLALLLILLAAYTILTKAAKKWFWLSVAAVMVVLTIWVFLPENNEGWRPFTFEEELATLKAKYVIPDSENAAIIYNQLLEDYNEATFEPDFPDPNLEYLTISEPWLSNDYPQVAEWLKSHENTIAKLIEASKFEKCRFPITADFTMREHSDRLIKMGDCTPLLISAANNDMAEGRTDAGLEKYLCLTRMANHLYQQPEMTDSLIGFAVESVALVPLKRFMIEGQPTKEKLQLIASSIKGLENNWSIDFRKWLDYDKLYCKNMFGFWYEINQKGKTRLSRDPTAAFRAWFPEAPFATPTYWHRKLIKAGVIVGWFFVPPTPQQVAEIVDETYEKYYAMADPNFDWSKKPPEAQPRLKLNFRYTIESLTNMTGQTYSRIREIYLRHLAGRRGSRLLVAIRQYKDENGSWPASLDAVKSLAPAESLIDPVSGKQFEYENHGKRFSLYGETVNIWPK